MKSLKPRRNGIFPACVFGSGENYPRRWKAVNTTLDASGRRWRVRTGFLHSALALLEAVCKSRGCLKKGGEPGNMKRARPSFWMIFAAVRLGRMTLGIAEKRGVSHEWKSNPERNRKHAFIYRKLSWVSPGW